VPGTELTPERRAEVVRNLTIAGWLLLGGPIGFIAFQFDRVRRVGEQPFAGVWDQRIEVLSFLMLPPNLVVLAPVVFVAALTAWLAGNERDPWVVTLLRVVAGLAITFAAIGAVSITSILLRDDAGTFDTDSVFLRLGGIAMAAGLALVCRIADRSTTP
jgi:MFS family permease